MTAIDTPVIDHHPAPIGLCCWARRHLAQNRHALRLIPSAPAQPVIDDLSWTELLAGRQPSRPRRPIRRAVRQRPKDAGTAPALTRPGDKHMHTPTASHHRPVTTAMTDLRARLKTYRDRWCLIEIHACRDRITDPTTGAADERTGRPTLGDASTQDTRGWIRHVPLPRFPPTVQRQPGERLSSARRPAA